jgi:topoisomerase-4 subunit A
MEATAKKQNWLGENTESKLILLTDTPYPRLEINFAEPDTFRGPLELDAEQFIAVKGFKAKGKRLTMFALGDVKELEPVRFPDPESENDEEGEENLPLVEDPDEGKSDGDIRDEITGQLKLF